MSDREFLTTRQLAEMLGVTAATIAAWRRTGRGPAVIRTPGNYCRYRRKDVEAWCESRRQEGLQVAS